MERNNNSKNRTKSKFNKSNTRIEKRIQKFPMKKYQSLLSAFHLPFFVFVSILIFSFTGPSVVNAVGNELNTALNLQDIGSLPVVPEVPTVNAEPNIMYTYTLSVTNSIKMGNDPSRKVSVVSLKPRLPSAFVIGGPVACPLGWPAGHLGDNSEGIGSVVCTESGSGLVYGQNGNVSFTFTTPPSAGTTDLALYVSYVKSDGLTQGTWWSPAVHIIVASPACISWTYSDWSSCSSGGNQTRNIISSSPSSCSGGNPILSQNCTYIPSCTPNDWSCGNWGTCSSAGTQPRACSKTLNCQGGASSPVTSQSCVYVPACTPYSWSCSDWSACTSNGTQNRTCNKISNCDGDALLPVINRSCSYTPPYVPPTCQSDIWQRSDWNFCSLSGIQSRSCRKTFDCPVVEDAAPSTSRSCIAPETLPQQAPIQGESINRKQILQATVKLECPMSDKKFYSQGSGTIIDEYGSILTNKHVVSGTIGTCRVGFINSEDDIPSLYEIADVKNTSSDTSLNGDIALLKIRNPSNKKFVAVDIFKGSSSNLKSGDTILPFGYPDENLYGLTITFTEGPYSGKGTTIKLCNGSRAYDVSGYFKTTASIDHGNSGGGAYQKSTGYFMGIPTLGSSCDTNIPSRINHILSINTIKKWITSLGSYNVAQNNYSSLGNYFSSAIKIEEINTSGLRALDAPTPDAIVSNSPADKSKGRKISSIDVTPSAINEPLVPSQIQKELPTSTESISPKQETTSDKDITQPKTENQPKKSWLKRFFQWVANLF